MDFPRPIEGSKEAVDGRGSRGRRQHSLKGAPGRWERSAPNRRFYTFCVQGASADGLRLVTPLRTVNAGPNSKYFDVRRGITCYNFTSDRFTGFHGIVIPGTPSDPLFILEGLLESQTNLKPVGIMSDTAGYSDVVLGVFWRLGYQFSPRLAHIGYAILAHVEASGDPPERRRHPACGGVAEAGDGERIGVDAHSAAVRQAVDARVGNCGTEADRQDSVPARAHR